MSRRFRAVTALALAGLGVAAAWATAAGAPAAPVASTAGLRGQVAFLRGGRIWALDLGTLRTRLLVRDAKPIDAFAFDPTLRRVAYTRVVGDRGEEAPDNSICEAVVRDLATGRAVAVARPDTASGNSPRIAGWVGADSLVLEIVSGFDVAGMELWHPGTGARTPWLAGEGENASDWAVDNGMLYFTSDAGIGPTFRTTLHARDLAGGTVRDLVARRSIMGPAPCAGGARVAYASVDFPGHTDSLWVHDRASSADLCVYAGPVGGKSGTFLAWSPDGRWLAVAYTNRANLVLDCATQPAHRVALDGHFVAWSAAGDLLIARDGALYERAVPTAGRERCVLRDCSDAVVLRDSP